MWWLYGKSKIGVGFRIGIYSALLTSAADHNKWVKKWFDKLLPSDTSFVGLTMGMQETETYIDRHWRYGSIVPVMILTNPQLVAVAQRTLLHQLGPVPGNMASRN